MKVLTCLWILILIILMVLIIVTALAPVKAQDHATFKMELERTKLNELRELHQQLRLEITSARLKQMEKDCPGTSEVLVDIDEDLKLMAELMDYHIVKAGGRSTMPDSESIKEKIAPIKDF